MHRLACQASGAVLRAAKPGVGVPAAEPTLFQRRRPRIAHKTWNSKMATHKHPMERSLN